jgi:hypothetical protein
LSDRCASLVFDATRSISEMVSLTRTLMLACSKSPM